MRYYIPSVFGALLAFSSHAAAFPNPSVLGEAVAQVVNDPADSTTTSTIKVLATTTVTIVGKPTTQVKIAPGSSSYWVADIKRQGAPAFGASDFQVYRNVKQFGAVGDGVTDDTQAINMAISTGNRCGQGCNSSTTNPALVYFPPGTYLVSEPIIQYYMTQLVGDAIDPPTIKASPNFKGIAVIDADPYAYENGNAVNWYINQNNFFRQIRNFVIDLTGIADGSGAGIHWQIAQATSLQNLVFNMIKGKSTQQGIFMDNGSGGFMSDLIFNGGNQAMFLGNQQFTTRNIQINGANTGVFMNWNWLWSLKSFKIDGCTVGVDIASAPGGNLTVGSILLLDSSVTNTQIGVNSSFTANSIPSSGGTLIIDNVDFSGTGTAVGNGGAVILAGNKVVDNFVMGNTYVQSTSTRTIGPVRGPNKPAVLLGSDGKFFERSKPQYENYPVSSFVSIKSAGAKGDGKSDDTIAIQKAINNLIDGQILYFDHGNYKVTNTIKVPGNSNIKITGEAWPVIMAFGSNFGDEKKPIPVFQIGDSGDTGSVEMTDLVLSTIGPVPGAKLIEWNSNAITQGANGLWDVHTRVGGFAGTELQAGICTKNPDVIADANPACVAAHTLFHGTSGSSVYLENTWFWVSDHELDIAPNDQINIFNGRGVLLESQNPYWLYGTASEHNSLYQYQFDKAANIYLSVIQTETPYYQPNPPAPAPFTPQGNDPTYSGEASAWGLRIIDSSDILLYGGGLYSFFQNWGQDCVDKQNCQDRMISIEGDISNVVLYGVSTKASVNMISASGNGFTVSNGSVKQTVTSLNVLDSDNRNNFCATIAQWVPS